MLDTLSARRFYETTHDESAILVIYRPLLDRLLERRDFSSSDRAGSVVTHLVFKERVPDILRHS